MKDRLEELMQAMNLTPTQFAEKVGIQRSTLQHILSGRNNPSMKVFTQIHSAFPDVDLYWLLYGTGEPFNRNIQHNSDFKNDYPLFSKKDFFQPTAGTAPEYSNFERDDKESKTKKTIEEREDEKKIEAVSVNKESTIKEIVILFDDDTYKKFLPDLKK